MSRKYIVVMGLLPFLTVPCLAITITVDDDGPADYSTIQEAIDHSDDGDIIKVSPGTYNENLTFSGIAVTVTSANPDDPNVVNDTMITPTTGDFSVTFAFGEDTDSVITGFTITRKPIKCQGTSPTITKNVIRNCENTGEGGAIYGMSNASPTISNNVIVNNLVSRQSLGNDTYFAYGGAISNCNGFITHNLIAGNRAFMSVYGPSGTGHLYGGALYQCEGPITNNVIVGNRLYGYKNYGSTKLYMYGGGLYECNGIVKNNIIVNNYADELEGIPEGGGIYGTCQSSYNDIWGNTPDNFGGGASPGIDDISRNPIFVNDGYWTGDAWLFGDYHLKSETGRWDTDSGTWISDDETSKCIDAGDPSDSIGSEPNPNGGRINMGAYGGTAQASKSTSGIVETICLEPLSMDSNDDCKVDFLDFAAFARDWLKCNLDPPEACWE